MPTVNTDPRNKHVAEVSTCVSGGAIALMIIDGAGWHSSLKLIVSNTIALLILPPYTPELNSVEDVWEYLHGNTFSHQVWGIHEAVLDAWCNAWNTLIKIPDLIRQNSV